MSQDERDFLTELAAKRGLVTARARYAEYAASGRAEKDLSAKFELDDKILDALNVSA